MSEIEKLYKNCNIKPKQEGYCDWDSNCPYPHHKCNDKCPYWKYEDEAKYPPFTAEKQLELIKWLGKLELHIYYQEDKYYIFTMNIGGSIFKERFEESLACYINYIWQDLTEEERKQIKEILE